MKYPYSLIGNCVASALVSEEGSVDWLCMPYFDSPSVFGRLLDKEKGGCFKIEAVNSVRVTQEYVRFTPILRTRFETSDGVFDLYDYMPRFMNDQDRYYCPAEIHRSIRVISGKPKIRVKLELKPNYASSECRVENRGEYLKFLSTSGEYHSYYLYSNLDFDQILSGREILISDSVFFLLSYHEKIRPVNTDWVYFEFERTKSYWLAWIQRTDLPTNNRELIIRSLITLKLLMYQRTGAVIAAPTTSLPEIVGKNRNWDYRYCWIRDASLIIELFSRLGHTGSSERYMSFILSRMLLKNDGISVVYGIHGEKILKEKTIDSLDGYQGSKPVRVGNEAYIQSQNDLYGELLDAIYMYFKSYRGIGFHFDQELWTAVRSLVNWTKGSWMKPDSGIWEYRGDPQHHVFSKLMSWVAMDRAMLIAKSIGKTAYAKDCSAVADQIKQDILKNGWNEKVRAFTMHYGSANADASLLLMAHYGFLPYEDPRIVKTVEFCHERLVRNGFVMRYVTEDDFGLPENAFLICTFWMVNALYSIGRKQEARQMFKQATATANHNGLMSEGVEPDTGRQTGNFPQGYSHMAFVQSALLLETEQDWHLQLHHKVPEVPPDF